MGLYSVHCPACSRVHQWFSGSIDQRCEECRKPREWYIQETAEGYQEFVTTLTPEELEKHHPDIAKGRDELIWHHVIEKSAFDFQVKQANDMAEAFNKSSDFWQTMVGDLQAQLLTEKAEVSRLLALNKRRTGKSRKP